MVYGIEFNKMTLCDNESPWSNIKEKKFLKNACISEKNIFAPQKHKDGHCVYSPVGVQCNPA